MTKEKIIQEFRLRKIEETRKYLLEETKYTYFVSKNQKKSLQSFKL